MKKRRTMLAAISVVIVAILCIGGTLAYFTSVTDTKTNMFVAPVSEDDVFKAILTEPNWDKYPKDENGSAVIHPGALIPKDPTITLTADSEGNGAYIGMVVRFSGKAVASMGSFDDIRPYLTDLQTQGVNCVWASGFTEIIMTWYPKEKYNKDEPATLFTGVQFPADMTADELVLWSDFKIEAVGAAVSASDDIADADVARTPLNELLSPYMSNSF